MRQENTCEKYNPHITCKVHERIWVMRIMRKMSQQYDTETGRKNVTQNLFYENTKNWVQYGKTFRMLMTSMDNFGYLFSLISGLSL